MTDEHAPKPESKQDEKALDEEKQKILEMSEISIWLDTYDDIFSDFDPRPYSKRSLSDDFLEETKKASREKSQDRLELHLLLPESERDSKHETTIKKRLRDHFSKQARQLNTDIKNLRFTATGMILGGAIISLAATYAHTYLPDMFFYKLLIVLLEPAGWFTIWYGFDKIFFSSAEKQSELKFYRKMSRCEVLFEPIEK